MSRFHRLLSVLTLALLLPPLAIANDEQEIQNYVLTDAALAKYSAATRKLAELPPDAAACEDDGDDLQSIDDAAAKLNASPAAKAALQSAGLTAREYVVFTFSLLQTGLGAWAADQPGGKLPPGTSKANVDFYKKRQADLKKLETVRQGDDCDDDRDDDEFDE
jgi:hypothetical protein